MTSIPSVGAASATRCLVTLQTHAESTRGCHKLWDLVARQVPDEVVVDIAVAVNEYVALADDLPPRDLGMAAHRRSETLRAASPINSVARSTARRNARLVSFDRRDGDANLSAARGIKAGPHDLHKHLYRRARGRAVPHEPPQPCHRRTSNLACGVPEL